MLRKPNFHQFSRERHQLAAQFDSLFSRFLFCQIFLARFCDEFDRKKDFIWKLHDKRLCLFVESWGKFSFDILSLRIKPAIFHEPKGFLWVLQAEWNLGSRLISPRKISKYIKCRFHDDQSRSKYPFDVLDICLLYYCLISRFNFSPKLSEPKENLLGRKRGILMNNHVLKKVFIFLYFFSLLWMLKRRKIFGKIREKSRKKVWKAWTSIVKLSVDLNGLETRKMLQRDMRKA